MHKYPYCRLKHWKTLHLPRRVARALPQTIMFCLQYFITKTTARFCHTNSVGSRNQKVYLRRCPNIGYPEKNGISSSCLFKFLREITAIQWESSAAPCTTPCNLAAILTAYQDATRSLHLDACSSQTSGDVGPVSANFHFQNAIYCSLHDIMCI